MKLSDGVRAIDVRRVGPSAFEIDGRSVAATASIGADRRVRVRFIQGSGAAPADRTFVAERHGERVFVADETRTRAFAIPGRRSATHHHGGEGSLESPMPGRVVKVSVAPGDRVRRGQELLVVEAMKMENALTAPFDGVVTRVAARAGEMVGAGAILVEVEDPAEASA
jgi:biotin carboxyl carrier protein